MMNMKAKKTRRYSWWKLRRTCRSWHGCFSNVVILLLIVDISTSTAAGATTNTNNNQKFDWLIHQNLTLTKSKVIENICWRDYYESTDGDDDDGVENVVCGIELTNNLITRRFALIEEENNGLNNINEEAKTSNFCFGTIDILMYDSLSQAGGISMLRSIEPEANLVLNGQHYIIGDLQYQSGFRAYLNRTNLRNNLDCARDGSNTTFRYKNHRIIPNMTKPFEWTPGTRHSMPNLHWPPKGIGLEIDFELSATANIISQERGESRGRIDNHIVVTVHYEIYDTIPVMSKWISISSPTTSSNFAGDEQDYSRSSFKIDSVTVERIASFPPYSSYAYENGASAPYTLFDGEANGWSAGPPPQLVSLTDQAHGTKCRWINDYESSNNTNPTTNETYHDYGATEPLLICNYTLGPSITVNNMVDAGGGRYNDNETSSTTLFTSFRSILLATDSIEPERYSLMQHRMNQVLLPHTTENPLYFHAIVEDGDDGQQQFETIVDQMMEVGFEMLVYSFGSSGFQLETSALQPNNNQSMMTKIRDQVRYAKSKGIEEVGGYDLICLQRGHGGYGQNIPDEWARTSTAIDPKTGQQSLSEDACFASEWYNHLLYDILLKFINFTDISMLVLDGPYGGSSCSSTNHSHHDGLEDSMYQQTQHQDKFLLTLRNMGIYLNIPDSYFFSGSNRIGIGYDEFQYSLPRWEQLTITRMGLYDDLYRYLPTQGWMFIPIGEYHGGGAGNDATFADHPKEIGWAMAQIFGAGTAATIRGPLLYNETTKEGREVKSAMKKWISFYKKHRRTLIQPIVHLRRPTMYTWDGWLHVNSFGIQKEQEQPTAHDYIREREGKRDGPLRLEEVGLAMIFNPTDRHLRSEIVKFPLYYTGLEAEVWIVINDDDSKGFKTTLGRDYTVTVQLDMEPKSIHVVTFHQLLTVNTESNDIMLLRETTTEH